MSEQKKGIDHFKVFVAWILVGMLAVIAPIPGSFVIFSIVITPIWFLIWLLVFIFKN